MSDRTCFGLQILISTAVFVSLYRIEQPIKFILVSWAIAVLNSMKLFVWDFHGVLEKGTERAVLEISNIALSHFGYSQRFTEEDITRLYGRRWFEYFGFLLPQESHGKHLELQRFCLEFSRTNTQIIAKHIQPNNHVHEVLNRIALKHDQILISNTAAKDLRVHLECIRVTPYFPKSKVFGTNTHQNPKQTKKDILSEYLKGKKFDSIVVIGDTCDDMNLVSAAEGTSYLYSHPDKPLIDCAADHRIYDLRELLREL